MLSITHLPSIAITLCLFAAIAARYFTRRTTSGSEQQVPEQQLLLICHGERALATRLIQHELRRFPNLTWQEATARALESYRRDHR